MPNGPGGKDRRRETDLDPHPDRARRIRQWHIERATSDTRPVALAAIHITEHGRLNTDVVGVDPAHAQIMASELRELAQQLERMAIDTSRTRLIRVK